MTCLIYSDGGEENRLISAPLPARLLEPRGSDSLKLINYNPLNDNDPDIIMDCIPHTQRIIFRLHSI